MREIGINGGGEDGVVMGDGPGRVQKKAEGGEGERGETEREGEEGRVEEGVAFAAEEEEGGGVEEVAPAAAHGGERRQGREWDPG